jgi:hypothetical protein
MNARNTYADFERQFIPEPNSGCWLWLGYIRNHDRSKYKYGTLRWTNKRVLAHRFAYEWYKGPIPAGKDLDHLCRNTLCVNPDHLEVVSHLENMRRSIPATKLQCVHGHFYADGVETYLRPDRIGTQYRRCLTCYRMRYPGTKK